MAENDESVEPIRAVLISPSWPPETAHNGIVTYIGALKGPLAASGVDVRVLAADHRPEDAPALLRDDVLPMPHARSFREKVQGRAERFALAGPLGRLFTRSVVHDEPGSESPGLLSVRATARAWRDGVAALHAQRPVDVYEMEESFGFGLEMNRPAMDWPGLSDRLLAFSDRTVRRMASVELEREWRAAQAVWRDMTGAAPGRQVIRLHGPWFLNGAAVGVDLEAPGHALRIRREGHCIDQADAVSAPSKFVLDAVQEHYGIALPEARVIPNAISRAETSWSRAAARPGRILFVGRFDRMKGMDTMIEAFARVHAGCPDATLVLVGPDRGLLRDGSSVDLPTFLAETLSPAARAQVEVRGPLGTAEIEKLRLESELTVVASRFEVFGMVVLEAMAFGCPLICSDAGALPEVYGCTDPKMMFRAGDAEQLAARLTAAFDEPGRVDASAKAGRERARTHFDPHNVARQTRALYETLVP